MSNIVFSPVQEIGKKSCDDDTLPLPVPDENFDGVTEFQANKPLTFTENMGQLDNDNVRFYDQNGAVWFTDEGVWFELREYTEARGQGSGFGGQGDLDPMERFREPEPVNYKRVVLKQEFVGANDVKPVGWERLSWNSNFFYGNDSGKWCTGVPNFAEIYYENLYDGIDLRYYTNEKGLKYDFIVYPGSEPDQIRIRCEGANSLEIDRSGNIEIKTQIEDIIDGDLFIYQNYDGRQEKVNGKFIKYNNMEYGFKILDDYSPHTTLVIDPIIELNYSTYIGGTGNESYWSDVSEDIEVDSDGNAFVTGGTVSLDFPTTPGVYDRSYNGGDVGDDVFVLKLNHNGSNLLYSTYIGGKHIDWPGDIDIDTNGNAFVTGETRSADFPWTVGAFDTTYNGSSTLGDTFIFKLNPKGSKLSYSTFIGGNSYDDSMGIVVDSEGRAIITGGTYSSDFPTTNGAFDRSHNSPNPSLSFYDVFVLKIDQNGSSLIFSTFIGGNKSDRGYDIAIDQEGNVFVTGYTNSSNFPNTTGAFDTSFNGGSYDAFIFKLSFDGSLLYYSTYIGGSGDYVWERGNGIVVDETGNAYVTGCTNSDDFPTTSNAYNRSLNEGIFWDTFILKLNRNGSKLIYSTFIGGKKNDFGEDIIIDNGGNVFVTGNTNSSNFPLTPNAYSKSFNNGDISSKNEDAFLLKLSKNGSTVLYSTYIGGENRDWGSGVALDPLENIYISGLTKSFDLPTTSGAFDTTFSENMDVFVLKFSSPPEFEITSVSLLMNNMPTDKIYSRYRPYTFRINITDNVSLADVGIVRLTLDPLKSNIQLLWNRAIGKFSEINDPNDHVFIHPSSTVFNTSWNNWSIDFNIVFNWTYPDEDFHNIQTFATSVVLAPEWFNSTNLYYIENDLEFVGELFVYGELEREIENNDAVRTGENLNWTGLTPVYEGTTAVYPPPDEFDVKVWDEDGYYILDSPGEGEEFWIQTIAPNFTDTDGYNYTINLSGIPPECDKTNINFTLKIDGDNVTFSNPWPTGNQWQKRSEVFLGVTITDHGGGKVDNNSVMNSISMDNGITWSDWKLVPSWNSMESINVQDFITFDDGDDNLIRWQASDSVGNGPVVSDSYKILVDTQEVKFSNAFPLAYDESYTDIVEVGITISDETSGVNASTVKYSISDDNGISWSIWNKVLDQKSGNIVDLKFNIILPNGTNNRIRWRAYDTAGNGPTISEEYIIIVNKSKSPLIPEVSLLTPVNNSIITKSSVELSWRLEGHDFIGVSGIKYDIYFGPNNPPENIHKLNITEKHIIMNDLENNQVYYWTILPKLGNTNGTCLSGVWSFIIQLPVPHVTLISPKNGSIVNSNLPTLIWSVEYGGIEEITYNIHFDNFSATQLIYNNHSTPHCMPNFELIDNVTYFWRVIPWVSGLGLKGKASEIWSFTVRRPTTPRFGLNLTLDQKEIIILPGETRYITASVTNVGDVIDNISLTIDIPMNSGLSVKSDKTYVNNVAPKNTVEFSLKITCDKNVEGNILNLNVIANSTKASDLGITIKDEEEFTVKIVKKDGEYKLKPNYWLLLVFIIIILILLITVFYIVKRNSSKEEKSKISNKNNDPSTNKNSKEIENNNIITQSEGGQDTEE